MKSILAALFAVPVAIPVYAVELVTSEKCSDKVCQDSFGHRPMAYCETSLLKTALGEVSTRHESFYANYQKVASGEWIFDLRTNTERTSLKFSAREFDELTGALNFTFRDTTITGICRRFSGQRLAITIERRPYQSPQPLEAALTAIAGVSGSGSPKSSVEGEGKCWQSSLPS
jgi:hypothetical protein